MLSENSGSLSSHVPSAIPQTTPQASSSDGVEKIQQSITGTASGAGPTSTANGSPDQQNTNRVVWPVWETSTSVLGNHAPLIVARGAMILFASFYNQVLTYDPVRSLLSPGGASGSAITGSSFGSLHIGIVAANLGTAFSAGVTFLDTNYCNAQAAPNDINPCPPRLSVSSWVTNVIITTLVIQSVVIVHAMSRWFHKPGGLSADPTTIAGVAAVMGHPEIERQFASYPGEISKSELRERLKDQRFKLGTFTTATGLTKYGIMPADDDEDKKPKGGFFSKLGDSWESFQKRFELAGNWKKTRFYFDVVFFLFLFGLLGLAIAAITHVDEPQVVFVAFSSGISMKIFFAILGVVVSFYWGRLFTGMHIPCARPGHVPGAN
jgi:hypothetical protein